MDWLYGCFKGGQRRRSGCSISRLGSKKDASQVSITCEPYRASGPTKGRSICNGNADLEAKTLESNSVPSAPRSESARTFSEIQCRHHPTSGRGFDQLSVIEKLDEDINNLDWKLAAEVIEPSILTDEVRQSWNCDELMDSSNAFKRVHEVFENTSKICELQERKSLLRLQSLQSKIGNTDATADSSLQKASNDSTPKTTKIGSGRLPLAYGNECHPVNIHATETPASNHLQMESSAASNVSTKLKEEHNRNMSAVVGTKLKEGHNRNMSASHSSFEMENTDLKVLATKRRRSSTTYSFSGFIVIENEIEDRAVAEHGVSELCRSEEASATNIIETPDARSDNLVETSRSLFAFATASPKSHPLFVDNSLPCSNLEDFSFLSKDSELDSSWEGQNTNKSPSCLQSEISWVLHGMSAETSVGQSQVETSEESYDGFSDVSSHKQSDLSNMVGCRPTSSKETKNLPGSGSRHGSEAVQLQLAVVEDRESVQKLNNSCSSASQFKDVNNLVSRNLNVAEFADIAEVQAAADISTRNSLSESSRRMHTNCCNSKAVSDLGVEENFCPKSLVSMDEVRLKDPVHEGRVNISYPTNLPESNTAAMDSPKLSDDDNFIKVMASCLGSLRASDISQAEPSTPAQNPPMEISIEEMTSSNNPSEDSLDTWPEACRDGSRFFSDTPSTPVSINSHASLVPLPEDDLCRLYSPPLRTPSSSVSCTETPNSIPIQFSPSSLGEDRPILGTVAAHWNHSVTSTKKWWDGKGIPNSTNKYKEDQKVSWHATPFEVRLERALAKQGRVFQKKLFMGAAEMEVSG